MIAICDKCNKRFNLTDKKIKQRWLDNGIQETYFKCPHCKVKYRTCITNTEIRDLQKKIENKKKIIRYKLKKEYKHIPESLEVEQLVKILKRKMDKFNGKT